MLRVNGFYGHVRRNDLHSLVMFAGFIVAFQVSAAVALLLPLLFFDTAHSPIVPLGYVERYGPIVFALGLALFLTRFLRHVASVRATLEFGYVDRRTDPRLVNIVETLAIAAGLPLPKVGLIETPARNAFACGLSASSAVVVVTRGLVESLKDDELAAVVAHEIAHIRNGDIRLMAAANVLMENLLLVQRKNLLRIANWKQVLLAVLMPPYLFLCLVAGFFSSLALTLARVSRLVISSSREFVADAEAVRLTQNPEALISALRQIEGYSAVAGISPQADAMMIDGAVEGPYATHPTIAERIAVLVRLSGGMTDARNERADTRPMAQALAQRGGASRRLGLFRAASATAPRRLLVSRVNAGVKENIFGLTPGVRRMLMIGFAILFGLQIWTVIRFNTTMARSDSQPSNTISEAVRPLAENSGMIGRFAGDPMPERGLRREVERLSSLSPGEARCFATEPYQVGDRGLHRVHPPDLNLVQAFSIGKGGGSSDITLERYLGLKIRSVRMVADADGEDLDRALVDYVQTRKSMLQVLHRFFDEAGLRLMQEAYDSSEDRAILDTLRRRLNESAPALVSDKRAVAEIKLLVSAPESFIPCVAHAD